MRRFADKGAPPDPRLLWVSDKFTGVGTYADPIDVTGTGGGSDGNVDGGSPTSIYGGAIAIDGGPP